MEKIKEAFGRVDKFSLENANRLCTEVECIEETLLSDAGNAEPKMKLIDASLQQIRELTEVLIWMDSCHDEWFEQVMEHDVMDTLERLATNALMPSSVKLQSLQSVTVMLQNLSRDSSLFYVCSNNHINRMVAAEFDIQDDEFVSLYVSFLKSLALRCTPDTVQFFFDVQNGAFPLWNRAVRLLDSADVMVRTATKQIIVTIAQLQDAAVSAFVEASISDVLQSVLGFVNAQIVHLAASVPSWSTLHESVGFPKAYGDPNVGRFPFSADPAATLPPPPAQSSLVVDTRALQIQLDDVEDELLYLNDLCRTPVPNAGAQAAAVLQRVLLPHFRSTIQSEVDSASSTSTSSGMNVAHATHSIPGARFSGSCTPASVVLAFLSYWSQVNTDARVAAALVDFFVKPLNSSSGTSCFTMASMVLESTRVDLHESVVVVCRHALSRTGTQPTPPVSFSPSLRFPSSLGQFFYANTPYQQTGTVLMSGPCSTTLPSKEKFVQKVWPSPPTATTNPFVLLVPHVVAALYTQLKYFQATRLSCVTASLSLLLDMISSAAPGKPEWASVYLELMKLVQRLLLDYVKQYASAIQKTLHAQKTTDADMLHSHISLRDTLESANEEAPLPIQDPYTPMFLKLKEAAIWMEAAEQARLPLLETAAQRPSKRDLYLFFPSFPLLFTDEGRLILNTWPPLLLTVCRQPGVAAQWAVAYHVAQESVVRALDYPNRAPVSDAECELNLYLTLLLMRRAFVDHAHRSGVDVLQMTLRQLAPQHRQSMYFTLTNTATALSVRCEITSEWHLNSQTPSIAPPGTPVCMVLPSASAGREGRELLFLDIPISVPEGVRSQELLAGEHKRRVLCSLDLAFVGINIHPRYPFKVVLSYQLSGHVMLLHLVTNGTAAAQMMVTGVEKAANECRQRGASFCFGLMNYRSALLGDESEQDRSAGKEGGHFLSRSARGEAADVRASSHP
ncbi:hypothetical protein Q4I30_007677 [Leishmania utingensis]|uniref:FPL domain-containing protein n=1 Tax=Leishmania utingensis TaxID=653362 RepID=A0AAW3A179_9TRYP